MVLKSVVCALFLWALFRNSLCVSVVFDGSIHPLIHPQLGTRSAWPDNQAQIYRKLFRLYATKADTKNMQEHARRCVCMQEYIGSCSGYTLQKQTAWICLIRYHHDSRSQKISSFWYVSSFWKTRTWLDLLCLCVLKCWKIGKRYKLFRLLAKSKLHEYV